MIPKISKIWLKMNFPRQIPIFFLVLSSMYHTATAWPVRVSANESCITPLYLLRVMVQSPKNAGFVNILSLFSLRTGWWRCNSAMHRLHMKSHSVDQAVGLIVRSVDFEHL